MGNLSKRTKWILALGLIAVGVVLALFIAGSILSKRFEPYIKQQAIEYLSKRFDSEVEFGVLKVDIPRVPPIRLFLAKGKGVIAQVTAARIVMRHKGRRDIPPMFSIQEFRFEADLGHVFDPEKRVALVHMKGMEIQVPPSGERPKLDLKSNDAPAAGGDNNDGPKETPLPQRVVIEQVVIEDSKLTILPRQKDRKPLEFELHRVVLDSVKLKSTLNYKAELTNPKPPGVIHSHGTFGPWNTESPSDTPLVGDYVFKDADLAVFPAIGGKLNSTGSFKGTLGAVEAKGEATVPDFRLRTSGNTMLLETKFEALVDGTNGNTVLKPVQARLNTTSFTTSGAVLKHDGDTKRSIDLDVTMPDGELMDLLRLAMKGKPLMAGRISLKAKIRVPPLQGKVQEKLILDGKFEIRRGQFLQDALQNKIDTLSKRGQGQPKNPEIDNVFSDMSGAFHLENEIIRFSNLTFGVPGAGVELAGDYDLDKDEMDFEGSLRLKARVSQTMTGWKRWVLKPVDPFFAKNGAGTFLKIKITGNSQQPNFGASR